MAKDNTCKNIIIALIFILILMLILFACKDTEAFNSAYKWAKGIGYPRPQGNLPNYKYGTIRTAREKENKDWKNVLKKKERFNALKFKTPQSKTVLV